MSKVVLLLVLINPIGINIKIYDIVYFLRGQALFWVLVEILFMSVEGTGYWQSEAGKQQLQTTFSSKVNWHQSANFLMSRPVYYC